MIRNYYMKKLALTIILATALLGFSSSVSAKVTGICSNCHTMHGSQDGAAVAGYGPGGAAWTTSGTNDYLTRGSCLGCHGSGNVDAQGMDPATGAPQVYHNGATDLAGGNFKYIIGAESKGHNVNDLGASNQESTLETAPGSFPSMHDDLDGPITNIKLNCAGTSGCHGNRGKPGFNGMPAGTQEMRGAHHQNVTGQALNTADEIYNSYRFLRGVKGFENDGAYKYQNRDASNHNEYFGATTPGTYGCSSQTCHTSTGVQPPNNTMSGFCATCHGQFHVLGNADAMITGEGIGGSISSPFTRHPTDVALPGSGTEYYDYNPAAARTFSVDAPVARDTVASSMNSVVTPGTTGATSGIVMCLSCHKAHATNFPDMLRWDYSNMTVGSGRTDGCFNCHTTKN